MKNILLKIPEYYFVGLLIITGLFPSIFVNFFFIGLIGILILQIIFKNRITGILLGALIFLINLYFLGALLSEFHEFMEFNKSAKKLLFMGLSIWSVNLVASMTMIYRYATAGYMRDGNP